MARLIEEAHAASPLSASALVAPHEHQRRADDPVLITEALPLGLRDDAVLRRVLGRHTAHRVVRPRVEARAVRTERMYADVRERILESLPQHLAVYLIAHEHAGLEESPAFSGDAVAPVAAAAA